MPLDCLRHALPGSGYPGFYVIVRDFCDNAPCESVFTTPECGLLDRRPFRSQQEARRAVFEFIEGCMTCIADTNLSTRHRPQYVRRRTRMKYEIRSSRRKSTQRGNYDPFGRRCFTSNELGRGFLMVARWPERRAARNSPRWPEPLQAVAFSN